MMKTITSLTDCKLRLYEKLAFDLGRKLAKFLKDETIDEIMLNPDGKLWIDSNVEGLKEVGHLSQTDAYSIIHAVAGINQKVINKDEPRLETELPFFNLMQKERFTAIVPPLVTSPCFAIRKRAKRVFRLEDYVFSKRLDSIDADKLKNLLKARKNIVVCGGPAAGKTSFTNSLIDQIIQFDDKQRIAILEDTRELICKACNKIELLSSKYVTLTDLVHAAMRLRPDRILVGEVRGKEALDMLKAWNTGCPGGIATLHANGVKEAIQRIADLTLENNLKSAPLSLIKKTINAIVYIERNETQKGFIKEIKIIEDENDEIFKL